MFFMKKLTMWAKQMRGISRYTSIDMKTVKRLLAGILIASLLSGCSAGSEKGKLFGREDEASKESADDSFVDFDKLRDQNEDIFAWIRVPDTNIDYPVVQSSDGDDSFYKNHNVKKEEDGHGAIYIEAANLKDMCDFNEVLHGASTSDGTMFSQLSMFLDKSFFDEHPYVYVYMDGNALIYYVFAAYTRDDTRLLEEYDFTYASGCQAFLDEIYGGRSMDKLIRQGWEDQVQPENFLITLTTLDALSGRQLIVVGCLVGDVTGQINREMDYGAPEY
ncbi:MAG: class B sortase [Butyrivibrio sp.]|nr:class B sortase [Butyrivibrio sp.]